VKNQLMLLRAFAEFRRSRPDTTLIVVGDGPERPAIEACIDELSLRDAVRMLGEVADTAPVYREFDAFVLSSRAEGTSMSILEALASGVCVVATDVGGNPKLLHNGECGVLVPSDDGPSLAAALRRIANDDALRRAYAEAGRRHVELRYSVSSVVDRYCDLYRGDEGSDLEIAKCVG